MFLGFKIMNLKLLKLDIIKLLLNNLYPISLYARQIAGTFVLLLIARYLSVYDYGLFSSYKNIATFCLMFANLGFNEYILVSSKANIKFVQKKVALLVVNAIILTLILSSFSIFTPLENHLLFILVMFRTFFDGVFFALILPYFQATKNFITISYINIVYSLCIILITVISYILKLSLINFLILNIIIGLFNFLQCVKYADLKIFKIFYFLKNIRKLIDKSIWSYIITALCYYLYNQIPPLYIATYVSKEKAALFFSAFTMTSIIKILISSFNQKILPELINKNVSEIKRILKQNINILFMLILGILIFFSIFGKILLVLFYGHQEYANANIVLIILSISLLGTALDFIYGAYISSCGKQKFKIPIQICGIILSFILLFFLKRFDILGVSITCCVSSLFVGIMYTLYSLKLLSVTENKVNINEKYMAR